MPSPAPNFPPAPCLLSRAWTPMGRARLPVPDSLSAVSSRLRDVYGF